MKNFLYLFLCILIVDPDISFTDFLENASLPFTKLDSSFMKDDISGRITIGGKPLRIIFIGQRDIVGPTSMKISQYITCEFETILTEDRNHLGLTGFAAENDAVILSEEAIEKRAGQLFREEWDIIWLDFNFNALPEGFKLTIIDRVEKGTGLIYIGDKGDVNGIVTQKRIDYTQLKAATFGTFFPECIGKRKKGIVTACPQMGPNDTSIEIGNYIFCAVNTILYTSQHNSVVIVTEVPDPNESIELESIAIMNYRIRLSNDGNSGPMTIVARYRNHKNEWIAKTENTYRVEKGKSFLTIEYPYLPVGTYSIDISLAGSDGIVALAGTSVSITSLTHVTGLNLWEMSAQDGGYIMGNINVSRPFSDVMSVTMELLDWRGRILSRKQVVPNLNMKTAEFAFKNEGTTDYALIVRAYLVVSNKLVQQYEKPAFIRKMFDSREFSLVVADDLKMRSSNLDRYKTLRDAGVSHLVLDMTGLNDMGDIHASVMHAGKSGAGIIPRITRIASESNSDIMDPVITELEYNDALAKRITAIVDTLHNVAPPAYSLGRNNMLTPYEKDVSFSETDIESFYMYLESKYETVENLNAAWQTNFTLFDDAKPVTFDDARKSDGYAAWLDTRLHMEEVLTQVHYGAFEAFSGVGSDTKIGIEGFENALSPFRGYNLFELTGFCSMAVCAFDTGPGQHGDRGVSAIISSFISPGSMVGLSVTGDSFVRRNEMYLRSAPWKSLFLGMNSMWWNKAYGGTSAALTPQYTISPSFSVIAEESREIMDGIDLLVGGSMRLVDKIGILYSPISKIAAHTTSVEHPSQKISASMRSFLMACQDAGYTPLFVDEDQLTEDWLIKNEFRILILPYIQAMSDETALNIERFVRAGGAVIADTRTGVMNDHLFMRETGVLDHIFGISQSKNRMSTEITGTFKPEEIEGGIPQEYTFGGCLSDPTVTARQGVHVMAAVGTGPAIIVNRYGNGTGIFLNIGMETYEKMRNEGRETAFGDIFSWCLFTGGMPVPYCSVVDSTGLKAKKINITVFRDENVEYIGILPDPSENTAEYVEKEYFLDLSHTGKLNYVYDIRNEKFSGAVKRIPLALKQGKAELFSLLPYRVKGMELNVKSPVVQVGGTLEYNVVILLQKNDTKPARHVCYIELVGPDGKIQPCFSGNYETNGGTLDSTLKFSPDDPPGRWVLKVKDVISGKTAERAFMIMATGDNFSQ
ncbi:MAG: beta-galactosidase trimerization domain-containing protein [Candidatus Latescibacteria bacterium]|nr:beta-galactosidase trimerization domain-containing protein [Candidatus Latescibacterota bacterium]